MGFLGSLGGAISTVAKVAKHESDKYQSKVENYQAQSEAAYDSCLLMDDDEIREAYRNASGARKAGIERLMRAKGIK